MAGAFEASRRHVAYCITELFRCGISAGVGEYASVVSSRWQARRVRRRRRWSAVCVKLLRRSSTRQSVRQSCRCDFVWLAGRQTDRQTGGRTGGLTMAAYVTQRSERESAADAVAGCVCGYNAAATAAALQWPPPPWATPSNWLHNADGYGVCRFESRAAFWRICCLS